jgi:nucleoside-diphosphate-sugar epimerase
VNIASGIPIALSEVLQEIGGQIGRPELIRLGARANNSRTFRIWANTKRLTSEVGWTPRYDLSQGIAQTIEWWQKRASAATHAQASPRLSPI